MELKNDFTSPVVAPRVGAAALTDQDLEQWKEVNGSARHWETLMFESAKSYFTIVTVALGAAGAVLTWASIPRGTQRLVIAALIVAAFLLSCLALVSAISQRRYLKGFYQRRREMEQSIPGLSLRSYVAGSGWTPAALLGGFGVAIAVSCVLLTLVILEPDAPVLKGARLMGADLSAAASLRQLDLEGACGDTLTRLPKDLSLPTCEPVRPRR